MNSVDPRVLAIIAGCLPDFEELSKFCVPCNGVSGTRHLTLVCLEEAYFCQVFSFVSDPVHVLYVLTD